MTGQATPLDGDNLRAALEDVARFVEQLASQLDTARDGLSVPDVAAPWVIPEPLLDSLGTAVSNGLARLGRLASYNTWRARYGAEGWRDRSSKLLDDLARDVNDGTVAWFSAWLDALSEGAMDEAWRLLRMPAGLAEWAVWLPDRAAAFLLAVESSAISQEAPAAQVPDLAVILALEPSGDDSVVGGVARLTQASVKGRIRLLLLTARLLALRSDHRAEDFVTQARQLVDVAKPSTDAGDSQAVSTTESFLARHGAGPAPPDAGPAPPDAGELPNSGENYDMLRIHEFIHARRTAASSGGAPSSGDPSLLGTVQSLVDGLPTVAGAVGRLLLIVESPAEELVLTVAKRLLDEDRAASADELAERLWIPSLPEILRAPVAELMVSIIDQLELEPQEHAQRLGALGEQSVNGGLNTLGRAIYERAYALKRDPRVMRKLADVIYFASPSDASAAEREQLLEAIRLCGEADSMASLEPDEAWVHNLRRLLEIRLLQIENPPNPERYWLVLREAVAGFGSRSVDGADRWRNVSMALRDIGLSRSSYFLAARYRSSDPDVATWELVYATLGLGRIDETLGLLPDEAEAGAPAESISALRAVAYAIGDRDETPAAFAEPLATGKIKYKDWLAEFSERRGSPEAGQLWLDIWHSADRESASEASFATCAGIMLGYLDKARELAAWVAPSEALQIGWPMGRWGLSVIDIIASEGREGWSALESVLSCSFTMWELEYAYGLTRRAFEHNSGDRVADLISHLDRVLGRCRLRLDKLFAGGNPRAEMAAELDGARTLFDHDLVDAIVDEFLTIVVDSPSADEEPADEEPGDEVPEADMEDARIKAFVPPSWFKDWEGRETDHEFFVRGMPLARAAVTRRGAPGYVARAVLMGVDPVCEPNRVSLSSSAYSDPMDEQSFYEVDSWADWYCPEAWLGGLDADRRQSAQPVGVRLYKVAAPIDAIGRVNSWSGPETVARRILMLADEPMEPPDAAPAEGGESKGVGAGVARRTGQDDAKGPPRPDESANLAEP